MEINWIVNLATIFVLCVVIASVLIPQIILIAYRKKMFDEPDGRKAHKLPVPRLGGVAFTSVTFFSLALVLGINILLGNNEVINNFQNEIRVLVFSFCAVMVLHTIGIADDLIGIHYRTKFTVQTFCAIMIVIGGLNLSNLHGFFWLHTLPLWLACPLTVFVIVFIINAINLIDGIDGLASGLCAAAFLTYGITLIMTRDYIFAAIAFANLGVLLPFFYYNVFGRAENHTKIFMGDAGSQTVGMCICICSLRILECVPAHPNYSPNAFVIAFAPLIIPCFDVVRVYFLRVRNGKNPFLPDKNHIHHKLLSLGVKPRTAMFIIVLTSLGLIGVNCIASIWVNINILLACNILIVIGVNMWISGRIREKKENKK